MIAGQEQEFPSCDKKERFASLFSNIMQLNSSFKFLIWLKNISAKAITFCPYCCRQCASAFKYTNFNYINWQFFGRFRMERPSETKTIKADHVQVYLIGSFCFLGI